MLFQNLGPGSTPNLNTSIQIKYFVSLYFNYIIYKSLKNNTRLKNIYILLDVLVCSIAVYFYELCGILTSP